MRTLPIVTLFDLLLHRVEICSIAPAGAFSKVSVWTFAFVACLLNKDVIVNVSTVKGREDFEIKIAGERSASSHPLGRCCCRNGNTSSYKMGMETTDSLK